MQIIQFARFAQNYAVSVSEFVRTDYGHESAAVSRHNTHLTTDDKRAAIQRLPDVTNEPL
jgi:hypothetical protein